MNAQQHSAVTAMALQQAAAPKITPDPRWDRIAAWFGCPVKTQASLLPDGNQYRMEYLPSGTEYGRYHRAFAITLFRVPKESQAAGDRTEAIIRSMFNTAVRLGAKLREFRRFYVNGAPVAIYEYVLNGEWNIGVIRGAGYGMASMIQLVLADEKAPSEEDRGQFREIANA